MKPVILIDGDQFLYRACVAVERITQWDDENHVLVSNEAEAWDVVAENIEAILKHFGTRDHAVALGEGERGDGRCFRYEIEPNYKGKRQGVRKPMCYHNVRAKLWASYNCVSFANLEADDILGILATKPGKTERIVVARDKDLKTVPGKLWDGREFTVVSEYDADYWHLYQTLIGDTADGYPGCPGVGPKKAETLMPKYDKDNMPYTVGEWWARVKEAFTKAGLTEADALKQARLARILRWSDWDSEKKEVKLWTPPTTIKTSS